MAFYYVEKCPLYTHFGERFLSWLDVEFYKKMFGLYWDDHMNFVFSFVNVVYHIDLCMLNHPCYPGMNPTWLRCMIVVFFFWIWFGNILLRIFSSIFKGIYLSSFSFFHGIFVWFWYKGDGGFTDESGSIPFSLIFWNSLRRTSLSSSLYVW